MRSMVEGASESTCKPPPPPPTQPSLRRLRKLAAMGGSRSELCLPRSALETDLAIC
jgi:hypothetical protein